MILQKIRPPQGGMAPGISIINSWRYRGRTFAHSCRRARVYTKNKYCEGGADGNALPGCSWQLALGVFSVHHGFQIKCRRAVPAFAGPQQVGLIGEAPCEIETGRDAMY